MPVQPVFIREERKPEVPKQQPEAISELPPKPEVETSKPAKLEVPPADVEEKTSRPEETSSKSDKKPEERTSDKGKTRKLKVYNGEGGRIHTEKQIEEILDWYLQTGELPDYVSERQRWSYKHHRTIPERRKLLEQQGIPLVIHEIGRHEANVIPISGTDAKRRKRASR